MLLSATDWTKQVALGILEINKSNTMGKEGTRLEVIKCTTFAECTLCGRGFDILFFYSVYFHFSKH